jgi:hypothetical protein
MNDQCKYLPGPFRSSELRAAECMTGSTNRLSG